MTIKLPAPKGVGAPTTMSTHEMSSNKVVEQKLARLRGDLNGWFSIQDLNDYRLWAVNGDRFEFPLPIGAKEEEEACRKKGAQWIESNQVKSLLNAIRPAIYAYCAGCECLRTPDGQHGVSCNKYYADWLTHQLIMKKAQSRKNSQGRGRLNPGIVQKQLQDTGGRIDLIAKWHDVTERAVRQCIHTYDLDKTKK